MSDVVITPVEHALGSDCTGVGSNPGDAMFFMCPGRMEGWNCYAKISPGENFATFLNGAIFPAKLSPDEIFPFPVLG